jgi:hypothetical protein
MAFAGGFTFNGPPPTVTSANITPDPSGIPYYDESLFLQVMRTGKVRSRDLSAVMPIVAYRNMTDEDLKAIYAYFAYDSGGSSSCGQFLTSDGMQTLSGKTRRRRSELTV